MQIFDSWAGVLGEDEFDRWCIAPNARDRGEVREAMPGARIIGFPKGARLRLERYVAGTGVDAIGIDWTVPLDFARDRLQPSWPCRAISIPSCSLPAARHSIRPIDAILAALAGGRFIFNLGHGILPETPIAHVEQLIARVRGQARQ